MTPEFWKQCISDPHAAVIALRTSITSHDQWVNLCDWARKLAIQFKGSIALPPVWDRDVRLWKVIAATQIDDVVNNTPSGSSSLPLQGLWEVTTHVRRAHFLQVKGNRVLVEACLIREDKFRAEFGDGALKMVKHLLSESNNRIKAWYQKQTQVISNLEMMVTYGDMFREIQETNAANLQVRIRS